MIPTLRRLHRWIGLALLLPLMVEGLTGTILALEPLWSRSMAEHVVPTSIMPPTAILPANAILAAAQALATEGFRPVRFIPPTGPHMPASVQIAAAGLARGQAVLIRIDPVSLKQVGMTESASGLFDWTRRLHANLLLPEPGGRSILGWVGVGMLFLIVLGVPLWWPAPGQVRAAFTVPASAGGMRLHRRLHGAIGIWLLPLLLMTAVTGTALGFPQTSRQWLGLPAGGPPRGAAGALPEGPATPTPDIDEAIALARAALPGMGPRMVMLPITSRDPLRLFMTPPGHTDAVSTSLVLVSGGRVVSVQGAATLSGGDHLLRWMRDLHAGAGIGVAGRLLVAVGGLALPVFGVTGAAMWLLKRRNRQRLAATRETALHSTIDREGAL